MGDPEIKGRGGLQVLECPCFPTGASQPLNCAETQDTTLCTPIKGDRGLMWPELQIPSRKPNSRGPVAPSIRTMAMALGLLSSPS